jgi:PAS domain S-box-containing protein
MLFTKPFLEFPAVIITRKKVKGPLNLEKMHGMKVSVVSEYTAHNFITHYYPKLNLDLVPDVETGLRKVSFGLSDAFVENLATATYCIEKDGITNLRIAGESGYFYRLGFASRNDMPELCQILEKGLAAISVDEKKAIYTKWIPVEPLSLLASKEFQAAIFSAFGVAVLIILGIFAWNRALARQVGRRTEELEKELTERTRMEGELRHAHEKLEKRVEERTTDLRNANELLEHEITVRKRTESVNTARLRLLQFAGTHSLDELLQATIDEAEALTGSLIGFYHFLEADQKTLSLQNWSTRTKAGFCDAEGKGRHYDISAAGVWVDCIHERRPVVHNNYASLPHRKGLPPEHPPVVRELVVPVFRGDKIVAILGVGNKPLDYTSEDVETVSLLADLAWEITERKRIEEELLLSHFCINKAAIGIFQVSLDDGRILRANESACRSLGYMSDELCAMSVFDIDPSLTWEKFVHLVRKAGFSGSLTFETIRRRKDGTTFPVEVTVNNREFQGKSTGFTFFRDITEQKRAIAELELTQFMVDKASTGIHRVSEEGNILYANEAICRSLGYTREELCSMTVFDIAPAFNPETFLEHRRITRAAGSRTFESIHRRKDGATFPVEITVTFWNIRIRESAFLSPKTSPNGRRPRKRFAKAGQNIRQ